MYPNLNHYLLALSIVAAPLAMAVWVGWKFRRHNRPPKWAAALLLGTCVFGLFTIIHWKSPGGWFAGSDRGQWWYDSEEWWIASDRVLMMLELVGLLSCLVTSFAILMRRLRAWPYAKSSAVIAAPLLAVVVWIDLRFRVIIEDSHGQRVEVQSQELMLRSETRSKFHNVHGRRLSKGVVYFGFCNWLGGERRGSLRGNLVFPNERSSPTAFTSISYSTPIIRWWEWPHRVKISGSTASEVPGILNMLLD